MSYTLITTIKKTAIWAIALVTVFEMTIAPAAIVFAQDIVEEPVPAPVVEEPAEAPEPDVVEFTIDAGDEEITVDEIAFDVGPVEIPVEEVTITEEDAVDAEETISFDFDASDEETEVESITIDLDTTEGSIEEFTIDTGDVVADTETVVTNEEEGTITIDVEVDIGGENAEEEVTTIELDEMNEGTNIVVEETPASDETVGPHVIQDGLHIFTPSEEVLHEKTNMRFYFIRHVGGYKAWIRVYDADKRSQKVQAGKEPIVFTDKETGNTLSFEISSYDEVSNEITFHVVGTSVGEVHNEPIDVFGDLSDDLFDETYDTVFDPLLKQETVNSIDDSALAYDIVSATIDRAKIGENEYRVRIYAQPRAVYEQEDGTMALREKGWHRFQETAQSQGDEFAAFPGYHYQIPDQSDIQVQASVMQIGTKKIEASVPKIQKEERNDHVSQVVTSFSDIYPHSTVYLVDRQEKRHKFIEIEKSILDDLSESDTVVYWEEISLPKNALVQLDTSGERIENGASIVSKEGVRIIDQTKEDGDVMLLSITAPVIFDNSDHDGFAENLSYRIERDAHTLRLGIEVSASYLLQDGLQYPVMIDPTYCSGSSACSITELYLRYKTSRGNAGGSINSPSTFVGYYNDSGDPATRQAIIDFHDIDSLVGLSGADVTAATLHMRSYSSYGSGTYWGSVPMRVYRIRNSWSESTLTYPSLDNTATEVDYSSGSQINVTTNLNTWYTWNILEAASDWIEDGSPNHGIMITEGPIWDSSTSYPTTWENRLYRFYTEDGSPGNGPYLTIDYTVALPDLVAEAPCSVSPTTVAPGGSVNTNCRVRNVGSGDAPSSRLGNYLSDNNICSLGDTDLDDYTTVSALDAGSAPDSIGEAVTIPATITPGTYYFCFIPNYNRDFPEESISNSDNYAVEITVTGGSPSDPYEPNDSDSTAEYIGSGTSYSWDDAYITAGDEDWYRFRYDGDDYYFRVTGFSDSTTGEYGVTFSRSGSTVTITTNGPSGDETDTRLYLYDTDGESLLDDNDDYSGLYSRIVYDLDAQPDLVITNLTSSETSGVRGGDFLDIYATVRNVGDVSTGRSSQLNYYWNGTYFGSDIIPALVAGETSVASIVFTVPEGISAGTYTLSVQADIGNDIAEVSEANNGSLISIAVSGSGGAGSDNDDDGYSYESEIIVGSDPDTPDGETDPHSPYGPSIYENSTRLSDLKNGGNYGADPVNLRTGGFEFTQTDFELPGRGIPISFTRTYNSMTPDLDARFGRGWSHSYNIFYYQDPTTKNVMIYHGGSLTSLFTTTDEGETFVAPQGSHDTLFVEDEYLVYRTLEGLRYEFKYEVDEQMKMVDRIVDTHGNATTLTYTEVNDVPLLTRITDAAGRAMSLQYGATTSEYLWDKVLRVADELGGDDRAIVLYTYELTDEHVDLIQVRRQRYYDGSLDTSILYEFDYDSEGRMTEYTDPRGTILHNDYDSQGRVDDQAETNPRIDSGTTERLIYEFTYLGSDSDVPGSVSCTRLRNYRAVATFYQETTCFDEDGLKLSHENGLGDFERWTYDDNGMTLSYRDRDGNTTAYTYFDETGKERLVETETLPNTTAWSTVRTYEYDDTFNKVTRVQETATDSSSASVSRTTNYTIDSTDGEITSITDARGNTEYFNYNTQGLLLSHADRNGNTTTFTYNGFGYKTGEAIQVTDASGSSEWLSRSYTYDIFGNLATETTPEGDVYTMTYDSNGNMRTRLEPGASTAQQFVYDTEGHMIRATDELGRVTAYEYDTDIEASLLEERRVDPDGADMVMAYEYDWLGNKTAEVDPNGNRTTFAYDNGNFLTTITTPVDTITRYYTDHGNLRIQHSTENQSRFSAVYDERHNLTQYFEWYENEGGFLGMRYVETTHGYNGFDQRTNTIDARGNRTIYTYDLEDNLTGTLDPLFNSTIYRYDANGNQIGVRSPRAGADSDLRNSAGDSVTYEYDELNRKIREINALNDETVYTYDGNDNLVSRIDWQNSDGSSDAHETTYLYDAQDRLTRVTTAHGGQTNYTYDAVDNMRTMRDPAGRTTTYTYDVFNRRISETIDGQTTSYGYDLNGNQTSITYPDDTETAYRYDAANRRTRITDDLGNYRAYTYDSVGNVLTERDKLGRSKSFTYDWQNRLLSETDTDGTETLYEYDDNHNRTQESIDGTVTRFGYDVLNRVASTTHPGGGVDYLTYDRNGNVIASEDAVGNTIGYTYDALDRMTNKNLPGDATDVSYNYDNWGNLTQRVDDAGTFTYTYDNENRLLTETVNLSDADTYSTTNRYNADGTLQSVEEPGGNTIVYTYDGRGLIYTVSRGPAGMASYSYSPYGNVSEIAYTNGITQSYVYDDLNRVTQTRIASSTGGVLFEENYAYDAESNRIQKIDAEGVTTTYTYDVRHQLTGVRDHSLGTGNQLQYAYDRNGNRTVLSTPFESVRYTYDNTTNELSSYVYDNRLTYTNTYDDNGSLTREVVNRLGKNIRQADYTWTPENRLASISYSRLDRPGYLPALPAVTMRYRYDDNGNRVMKNVAGEQTFYLNSGLVVSNEINGDGDVVKSMVQGVDQLAEIDPDGNVTYTHRDVLGSAVLETDETGAVLGEYKYDPFGELVAMQGDADGTDYLYTGQQFDTESDLYYYNARYYNPATGRFISRDTYMGNDGDSLSRNRYIYVSNNPLKYTDPTGEFKLKTFGKGLLQLGKAALGVAGAAAMGVAAVAIGTTGIGLVGSAVLGVGAVSTVDTAVTDAVNAFNNFGRAFKDEEANKYIEQDGFIKGALSNNGAGGVSTALETTELIGGVATLRPNALTSIPTALRYARTRADDMAHYATKAKQLVNKRVRNAVEGIPNAVSEAITLLESGDGRDLYDLFEDRYLIDTNSSNTKNTSGEKKKSLKNKPDKDKHGGTK